ncbi:acyl-CoA dehydrogenase family protein [Hypericibacter sp.]|uniref:acyl-CoA dehydrogenase family protein n=1 Tax=Hypericibacter sp. TaxID=2705401 RepID=UPI003D6C82DB
MAKPYPKMTIELESLAGRAARLAEEFAVTAGAHDRTSSFPHANFARLAQEGLLALNVPKRFGGRAGGLEDAVTVIRSIAQGEPSTALVLAMHYIHLATAARSWPASWAERLGREAANEVSLINALRVEPELGTPARGGLPATLARRTPTGWSLSGHKIYSTGIPILSWLAVWARTEDAEPKVGTFLVPGGAPGIEVRESWNQLGMRASASHDVILQNVVIPEDHAVDIRPLAAWSLQEPNQYAWSTLLVAAVYHGVALAARHWFLRFARTRAPSNLGAPLASLPRFQEAAGEIETLLGVNDRLLRSAARDTDEDNPPSVGESGQIKLTVTNQAIAAVEIAVKLSGNPGLSAAEPLERHFRDVICGRIHTPQDDSVRIGSGRRALDH